ncbi:hypothetical protein [Frondihabitans cladoniiphilus]|uniref:Uncharacterized protein n=1 Tax=Frondihabitans cladoniiphilus TaxID=715785 RepID=A0ABP8VMQ8_9MICO
MTANGFTVRDLQRKLEDARVDRSLYSIGKGFDETLCLVELPDGSWETFVGQRGVKDQRLVWPDEETACYGFLGQIAWTHW